MDGDDMEEKGRSDDLPQAADRAIHVSAGWPSVTAIIGDSCGGAGEDGGAEDTCLEEIGRPAADLLGEAAVSADRGSPFAGNGRPGNAGGFLERTESGKSMSSGSSQGRGGGGGGRETGHVTHRRASVESGYSPPFASVTRAAMKTDTPRRSPVGSSGGLSSSSSAATGPGSVSTTGSSMRAFGRLGSLKGGLGSGKLPKVGCSRNPSD